MKNFFKPARIGFYVLMLLAFFIIGLYYAGYVGASKGEGLAGGAIVLGYGIIFGGVAFVASFFIAHFLEISKIKIINWVLLILILATWGYKHYQFRQRDSIQEEKNAPYQNKNKTPTEIAEPISAHLKMTVPIKNEKGIAETSGQEDLGIGFFKPNFHEYPTLYFYGGINLEKVVVDHLPQDSLVLRKNQNGDFTSTYAPPYLLPEHMKLDYGIFHFKALGIGYDFVKVEVNKQNGQIAYLNKNDGEILYWPEFLLSVNTIEMLAEHPQPIKIKPLDHASQTSTSHAFLKPLLVQGEWMLVLLTDKTFTTLDTGWIRWNSDGKLLISFSFLS